MGLDLLVTFTKPDILRIQTPPPCIPICTHCTYFRIGGGSVCRAVAWAKHCWEWEWSWDEDPDGVGVVIGMARRPGTRAEWMKWWRTGTSDGFHLELMQSEDPDDPEPDEHDPWGRWWYKWCEDCDRKECDGMSLQHFSEREYPADHPYLQTAAEARRPAPPKQRAASMAALGLVDAWAAAINAAAAASTAARRDSRGRDGPRAVATRRLPPCLPALPLPGMAWRALCKLLS